jgi:hypothetical protein
VNPPLKKVGKIMEIRGNTKNKIKRINPGAKMR